MAPSLPAALLASPCHPHPGASGPPLRSTHLVSYHAHNERSREEEVLKRLLRGELLALVSDAGMPVCPPSPPHPPVPRYVGVCRKSCGAL